MPILYTSFFSLYCLKKFLLLYILIDLKELEVMNLPKILDKANYLSASSGKRLALVLGILPICTCYALIWPSSWAYPSIFLLSIDILVKPPHSVAFSIYVDDPSYIQTPGLHTDCYPCRIMSSSFSWSLKTSIHLLVSFLLPLVWVAVQDFSRPDYCSHNASCSRLLSHAS